MFGINTKKRKIYFFIHMDIFNEKKEYWMPDNFPYPTLEWNISQQIKNYLLPNETVRKFPGWYYDNGAHVDDDYLFYNEGWKLLLDNEPQLGVNREVQVEIKPQKEWDYSEEKVVKKTYWEREIFDIKQDHNPKTQKLVPVPDHFWEKNNNAVFKIYEIVEKKQNEIEFDEKKMWWELRDIRNKKLSETDYIFIRSIEENFKINPEVIKYRQELRDLPLNVIDIYNFNYPEPPNNYFIQI